MKINKNFVIGIFVLAILLIPLATASENVNTATNDIKAKSSHFFTDDKDSL